MAKPFDQGNALVCSLSLYHLREALQTVDRPNLLKPNLIKEPETGFEPV